MICILTVLGFSCEIACLYWHYQRNVALYFLRVANYYKVVVGEGDH
jgi:hypothetical protein